jgi:hypothetical protein
VLQEENYFNVKIFILLLIKGLSFTLNLFLEHGSIIQNSVTNKISYTEFLYLLVLDLKLDDIKKILEKNGFESLNE